MTAGDCYENRPEIMQKYLHFTILHTYNFGAFVTHGCFHEYGIIKISI